MTTKRYEYIRPWMYKKQQEAIFDPARIVICEASTKSGKTAGCLIWLTEQAIAGRAGRNYWWVAPILGTAKIAFRRLKRALPRHIYTANESEITITLLNGATIWFKGADHPDSLYGEDVYAAVIDEASRCKEDTWAAIRSTLTATQGPIRIIGNVKGRKNWAYRLGRMAESGAHDMAFHKLTAYDAVEGGIFPAEEIESARAGLPEAAFNELYLAEPSDDGGNPFGLAAIAACVAPLSAQAPICFGWDVAKSQDWTVGIGLDGSGTTCRFDRWQAPWEVTHQRILSQTENRPALVDSTGVGDPVLERLQREGAGNFEGFKFSSQSKQQLMEGLSIGIQRGELHFPDGPIKDELDEFEFQYTRTGVRYSAPDGLHDDCVMALALAWRCGTMPRAQAGAYDLYDEVEAHISRY